MGPEGGSGGGTVIATGTPEAIAKVAKSHTGLYLKRIFDAHAAKESKKTAKV